MLKWTKVLQRLMTLQVFDESRDCGDGRPAATMLMAASALIGHVCVAVGLIGLFQGSANTIYAAMLALLVCFTLTCGLAWHAGLTGRAKNGLVLMLAVSILLLFLP